MLGHATDSPSLTWAINRPIGTIVSSSAKAVLAFSFFQPKTRASYPSSKQMANNNRIGEGSSDTPLPLRPRLG